MKMPFGKHKGKEISLVPKPYLRWLRQQGLDGWLAGAVDQALGLEPSEKPPVTPWQPSEGEPWPWATEQDE